jgi:hypothetical protein
MAGHFDPAKFEDRYETAMRDLIDRKQAGEKMVLVAHASPQPTVNLMEALRASLVEKRPPAASVPHRAGARVARRMWFRFLSKTSPISIRSCELAIRSFMALADLERV